MELRPSNLLSHFLRPLSEYLSNGRATGQLGGWTDHQFQSVCITMLCYFVSPASRSNRTMSLEIWSMLHEGTRRPGVSAHGVFTLRVSALRMSARYRSVPGVAVLIVGIALLASPRRTFAQHGGGGGGGHGSPSGGGRPGGVSEKDDLKDFHRAMAVRASAQQSAAFASLVQDAQAASAQLQAFREFLQKVPASSALSDRAATLDQAIEKVRTG